jgi:hypothetical protein
MKLKVIFLDLKNENIRLTTYVFIVICFSTANRGEMQFNRDISPAKFRPLPFRVFTSPKYADKRRRKERHFRLFSFLRSRNITFSFMKRTFLLRLSAYFGGVNTRKGRGRNFAGDISLLNCISPLFAVEKHITMNTYVVSLMLWTFVT